MLPTTSQMAAISGHVPAVSEMYRYSEEIRNDIELWLLIMDRIDASPLGLVKAAQAEAGRHFARRGMSAKNIIKKYYDYRASGDWRTLIDKRLLRTKATKLPVEFVEFWRGMASTNMRKCKPAFRKLVNMWRAGEDIPGYGTWRTYWAHFMNLDGVTKCPEDLPEGWSYENLMRLKPDRADLSLARYGIAATRHMLPHVIGTRENMRPLEYIAFDDVELDFLVLVPGVERPCKLRAIICKDVATDAWLRYVLRPAILREDGVQDGLKLKDMKRLCLELLVHFGYPVDYVSHWIVERGTATLPEADIAALHQISAGMIKVHETSMITGKIMLGGYADKSVGNSWGKAWIESGFNRVHNELAALPGQKGRRYDLAPAELEERKKAAVALIRAGRALPVDLRVLLRLPFPSIVDAHTQLRDALMRINLDRDHKCEGFAHLTEWRLAEEDPWKPYEKLLELPPEIVPHVMTSQRLETRMERWARLTHGMKFQKMPEEVAPRWMDDHRLVKVEKYQIKFQHEGRTLVYFDRDSALLIEGAQYLAYYNPFDLDAIYLTNLDGAYRGKLPRVHAVQRGDQEALEKRLADTRHVLNERLAAVRSRAVAQDEQALADMEANIAAFNDTPSTPVIDLNAAIAARDAEKAQAKARRAAARNLDAADLLDDEEPSTNEEAPITINPFDPASLL
jgi:hypothetical protein